jgi:hypothetical protein
MSDDCRKENKNSGDDDQSPFFLLKFPFSIPMRTTTGFVAILHRITSFLVTAGKEVVPSTLSGLAAELRARSKPQFFNKFQACWRFSRSKADSNGGKRISL